MQDLCNDMNSRQANLHEIIDNLSLFSLTVLYVGLCILVCLVTKGMIFHLFTFFLASHSVVFQVTENLSLNQSSYLIDGALTFQ